MPDQVPSFYVDQMVRLWVNVEQDGALTDPTEVTIMHRDPSGNEASEVYNGGAGNVVKSSTGEYYLDLTLDEAGDWYWRVKTTGVVTAYERRIHVYTSNFDNP